MKLEVTARFNQYPDKIHPIKFVVDLEEGLELILGDVSKLKVIVKRKILEMIGDKIKHLNTEDFIISTATII